MNEKQINVIVNSPDKLIWEGRADSVSSENTEGTFDILPEHANFVTMIENKPVVVRSGGTQKEFQYQNAVLVVRGKMVTIYAGI